MLTWHIITGEYPPVLGGVSDYSHLVAEALAGAGDDVHVWCPRSPELDARNGVTVHRRLDSSRRAICAQSTASSTAFPRRAASSSSGFRTASAIAR